MSHAYPKVISARLTSAQLARVLRAADRSKLSPSAYVRGLMIKLADGATGTGDPEAAIAAVCKALGLPTDSETSAIQAAFAQLVAALNPTDADSDPLPADGATEHADPKPAGPPGTALTGKLGKLTAYERKLCAERGIAERDYVRIRDQALTKSSKLEIGIGLLAKRSVTEIRADRELAAMLKAKGWTPEQFATFKAKAVKTTR